MLFSVEAANTKCKFQTDVLNVFTNEQIRWTHWDSFRLSISMGNYVMVNGISEGERKYLGLRLQVRKKQADRPTKHDLDNAFVVPEGAKLLLLMADDSFIELHTDEEFVGDSDFGMYNNGVYGITSEPVVKYPLDSDSMSALTAQRVKQIRLSTTDRDIDFEFGKKGSKKMQEVLLCIR
jgi:hypothetical protein